jgi:hypothetical protein
LLAGRKIWWARPFPWFRCSQSGRGRYDPKALLGARGHLLNISPALDAIVDLGDLATLAAIEAFLNRVGIEFIDEKHAVKGSEKCRK